jgi:hypothetical protein
VGSAEQEDKTLPLLQALQVNLAPLEGIRNTTALTDGNLRYVAIELRKPIVQILVQTTPPTITSAIYGLEVLRDAVVILVPDANEGPSIVVNQDVNEMVIPIDLVEGVIQQTVNETLLKRKFKGKKILMPKPTLILPEEEEPPAE